MPVRLNVGCGNDKLEGYLNADITRKCNPDVVCTLGTTLPFEDNTFDEVRAFNVLTQVGDPSKFVCAMNELHRITKGFIHVRVPNAIDICAWQDPLDVRRFTNQSFTYMEYGHRRYTQYGIHYGFPPFKVELVEDNGVQMHFKLYPVK